MYIKIQGTFKKYHLASPNFFSRMKIRLRFPLGKFKLRFNILNIFIEMSPNIKYFYNESNRPFLSGIFFSRGFIGNFHLRTSLILLFNIGIAP